MQDYVEILHTARSKFAKSIIEYQDAMMKCRNKIEDRSVVRNVNEMVKTMMESLMSSFDEELPIIVRDESNVGDPNSLKMKGILKHNEHLEKSPNWTSTIPSFSLGMTQTTPRIEQEIELQEIEAQVCSVKY